MNYTFGDAAYTISEDFDEFEAEIEKQQNRGLYLNNLEYVDGEFVGIFGNSLQGESIYSPKPHADLDDFTDEIRANRRQGYDLLNIESIDDKWFGIYQENTDGTDDIITPSDEKAIANPSQDIINIINKNVIPDIISNTFDL